MFDLALFGNRLDRTYKLASRDMGEFWTVAATTVSYGQPIRTGLFKRLALGIGIKHLAGINYGKAGGSMDLMTRMSGFENKGRVTIKSAGENDFNSKRINMNGTGFAADFGLACEMNDRWSLGLSLINISNGITWKKDTRIRTYDMSIDDMVVLSDSTGILLNENKLADLSDTTGIVLRSRYPATFSAGIAYHSHYLSAELNLEKGFYNGAGSYSRWHVSQGVEITLIPFLPIRAGIGIWDNRTVTFSSGFGIKIAFIHIDAAGISQGFPGYGIKGMGFSLSTGFEF
jgi:hypothetical protein